MLPAPFIQTPGLTAIAIGYRNTRLIADDVLPRIPVSTQAFKYLSYPLGEALTIPNTRVGRRSEPTNVEFSGTEIPAATDDYSLQDSLPNSDIDIAAAQRQAGLSAYDPKARATQTLLDLLLLDREVRVANIIFNAANYDANKQIVLSGQSQFSDQVNSTPLQTIMNAMDSTLVYRPNVHVIGRAAWTALRSHPHLVNAVKGAAFGRGFITKEEYAALFEIEELLVGESFLNSSKPGQTVTASRVWGKHLAMFYRDKNVTTDGGITFGFTAQWGSRLVGEYIDPTVGMRGGTKLRVGEAVKELIVASPTGFLIQNIIP